MNKEEKSLLLKDLSARLPYGVILNVDVLNIDCPLCLVYQTKEHPDSVGIGDNGIVSIKLVKPYLRPMSSMTEEECMELLNLLFDKEAKHFYINGEGLIDGKTANLMKEGLNYPAFCPNNITLYTDWLIAHHFDVRNLIEKDLALEAPEGMYNNKE